MIVSYGKGFEIAQDMRPKVERLQAEISKLPQFEPETINTFHAGMLCREVKRPADVLIVGKVHKKEHLYMVVSGTVVMTTDEGVRRITGPALFQCKPGAKRAIYSETPTHTMTLHRTDCLNLEDAENELVEADETAMFDIHNKLIDKKIEVKK